MISKEFPDVPPKGLMCLVTKDNTKNVYALSTQSIAPSVGSYATVRIAPALSCLLFPPPPASVQNTRSYAPVCQCCPQKMGQSRAHWALELLQCTCTLHHDVPNVSLRLESCHPPGQASCHPSYNLSSRPAQQACHLRRGPSHPLVLPRCHMAFDGIACPS